MQYIEDLSHYITDAIEMLSSWDLSEDEFQEAVHQQAQIMAGIEAYFHNPLPDTPSNLTSNNLTQIPLNFH
jgi:hypothetical protein